MARPQPSINKNDSHFGSAGERAGPSQQVESFDPRDRSVPKRTKHWEHMLGELPTRCDLNAFTKQSQRHQVDLRKPYSTKQQRQMSKTVTPKLQRKWETFTSCTKLLVESALLFSWHKALHVYGAGEVTAVATIDSAIVKSGQPSFALPITVEHADDSSRSCQKSLESISKRLQPATGQRDLIDTQRLNIGLFDSAFVMTGTPARKTIQSIFPFTCIVHDDVGKPRSVDVLYPGELFDEALMSGLLDVFLTVLDQVIANPSISVTSLNIISEAQFKELNNINNTDGEYDRHKRLNHLFEEAVSKTPEKVAIRYREKQVTYQHLNAGANRLAHYLVQEVKIRAEQLIALFLDKSELMILVVLAIWKSGACYSPIDPSYPDDRIKFSLTDTNAKIVLASKRHVTRISHLCTQVEKGDFGLQGHPRSVKPGKITTIGLEDLLERLYTDASHSSSNLQLGLRSKQLAYVTYTSGTTGTPKGIEKRHQNVVNSITDLASRYGVKGGHEVVILFSPYVFEPFVRQMLMALLYSHVLVVVDDDIKLDPVAFPNLIRRYDVTYLNGTASVLQEYDYSACPSLKKLVLVGEDLTEVRYNAIRKKFRHLIINEYGFTESAFVTAMKSFEAGDKRTDRSLGRPLRNIKCYVLNPSLKMMPVGAVGDLWVAGQGVSKGYLNREALTRERFFSNPFQTDAEKARSVNSIMYKTGDLAKWIPGKGEIEYLGRNDFQIKLRGIRIEPGEIESILASHAEVVRAVVVAQPAASNLPQGELGSQHLIGYYTSSSATESQLLAFLSSKIPRYMIPTRLVCLKRIPTTINGKVDFKALPKVDLAKRSESNLKPRNATENAILEIWAGLLKMDKSKIGIRDDFFQLGGHSITCIQLVGRSRQSLQIPLTVEQVFAHRTIEALASLVQKTRSDKDGATRAHSPKALKVPVHLQNGNVEAAFLASSLQQGFMYRYLKRTKGEAEYIMQSVCQYDTVIDPAQYEAAWIHAQKQYAALRLRFVCEEEVYQLVEREAKLNWCFTDLSQMKGENLEVNGGMASFRRKDREKGYRLEAGMLFRVYLVKFNTNSFAALFSCHHAILDGWSIPILLDYVHTTYLQLSRGPTPATSPDTVFFRSQLYMQEQRNHHRAYWMQKVKQINERCDLKGWIRPSHRYKVNLAAYEDIQRQGEKTVRLEAWSSSPTAASCSRDAITLHTVLQFVWHKILHAYGGGRHTVVGTIVSGRALPVDNVDSAVGLFINTLPLVVDHLQQKAHSVLDAMRDIQKEVTAMNDKSIVELAKLQGGKFTHGLFDSLFVLENYPVLDSARREQHARELKLQTQGSSEKLDYPLAVICDEDAQRGLTVTVRYADELFDESTIDEILRVYTSLYQQVRKNVGQPAVDLECFDKLQATRLEKWNATNQKYPQCTLGELFVAQAERVPEKLAIVYEQTKLTYRELNDKTNQLARYLCSVLPCKKDAVVGLVLDKNENMFISILAIWKAGLAYTPIDPSFPADRVKYLLEETHAIGVMLSDHYSSRITDLSCHKPVILPVQRALTLASKLATDPLPPHCSHTDLAYIYFTSGTTGKPKGVMIEHRGVVNLQASLSNLFGLKDTEDEVILSFSNYCFDHFVEMMTDALLNGQLLLVLNDEMRADKDRLYQYMAENKVTYLSGTPSVISMYNYAGLQHLRRIDCVGEDFSEPVFDKIRKDFKGMIINGYGPTEVSITTHKRLYPPGERRSDKSIGRQVANSQTYILSEHMKRIPIGATGELFLGGDGVARGYLNREQLTAAQFPRNPFQSREQRADGSNSRLYKTGDLARWLPNGEVEFLGRGDSQIKLRGQRVELGEIEAAISSCSEILQSRVVAKILNRAGSEVSQTFLVGYYIPRAARQEHELKRELRTKLPEYLIPNRLVPVLELPVTLSGKLDLRRLPDVKFAEAITCIEPRSEIEIKLRGIWGQLLNVLSSRISVVDDFFSLGGDSLMSTKLSFMATQRFNRKVTLAAVFKHRTIQSLARFIQSEASEQDQLVPVQDSVIYRPLSFAQERSYFIHEFEGGSDAYNIDKALHVKPNVSLEKLRKALQCVVARHSALRTKLVTHSESNQRCQVTVSEDLVSSLLPVHETKFATLSDLDESLSQDTRRIFQLDEVIPIRARILTSPGTKVLGLVFHHSAFDGWSFDIFQRDLELIYQMQDAPAIASSLPMLPIQYSDYCIWQRRHMRGDCLQKLRQFWSHYLEGLEPVRLVPDFSRPSSFNYDGDDIQLEMTSELSSALKDRAQKLEISFYSILLGAFALFLSTYSNQQDVVLGIPMSNRSQPEVDNVIGLFVNVVAIRLGVSPTMPLASYLKAVNEEVIKVQLHQDMPFEELVRLLGWENDPGRHPVFQHVFNSDTFNFSHASTAQGSDSALGLTPYKPRNFHYSSSKFDLSVTATEANKKVIVNFNYPRALFSREAIIGMRKTFLQLLEQVAEPKHSERCLGRLALNTSREPYGHSFRAISLGRSEPVLHKVFESQVSKVGNRVALVSSNCTLTFSELEARANQLAHVLQRLGVKRGQFVVLIMKKCVETIIAILAIWKTGAAYVPLDPSYPRSRIRHALQDTKASLIISTKQQLPRNFEGHHTLYLDQDAVTADLVSQPREFKGPVCDGNDFAYCIYTSGTTGNPKGVLVKHCNIINFRNGLLDQYFGGSTERYRAVLQVSNIVFDFSIEQFVLSFLSANKLIIPADDLTLDDRFYDFLNSERLSYLSGTPSLLSQIDLSRLHHLQMLTSAGEELQEVQFDKMRKDFKGPINNAYGITETTIYNTISRFEMGQPFHKGLGTLIANQKLYVASSTLQPRPPGAIGEIFLAGESVTAGYLNDPERTKARFLPNPFRTEQERDAKRFPLIYKSGDLGRYVKPGQVEYLGRIDTQVKLRGYRIELGEVSAAVSSCPGVSEATVLAHTRNEQASGKADRLVAYYVSRSEKVSASFIKNWLQDKLPEFCVPSAIIRIPDHLPVNLNGKLDKKILVGIAANEKNRRVVGPRNRIEAQVCRLIAELLNSSCGVDDDFFKIGGDSILSLQLASRVRKDLGLVLTVKDIFKHRTIAKFVSEVLDRQSSSSQKILFKTEQGLLSGQVRLLPIQEWFFNKSFAPKSHWNQCFTIQTGLLSLGRLKKALSQLASHHDSLRMRYTYRGSPVVQCYSKSVALPVEMIEASARDQPLISRLNKLHVSLDIQSGPVARICYLYDASRKTAQLIFIVHHLVVDTVSWRIIARDLQLLYDGKELGSKAGSYRQWAETVAKYRPSEDERSLWNAVIRQKRDSRYLTAALDSPFVTKKISLSPRKTSDLTQGCSRAFGAFPQEVLLSALGSSIHQMTGDRSCSITLEGHGRDITDSPVDVSNTVGWFTVLYPIILESLEDVDHARCISRVCSNVRRIPNQGVGYGAIYGYVKPDLPQITFNFLGTLSQKRPALRLWSPEPAMDGRLGQCQAPTSAGANRSVLDVTAWIDDGALQIELSTRLDEKKADRMTFLLNKILLEMVDLASREGLPAAKSEQRAKSSSEGPFIPYIEFNDTETSGPILFLLPPGEGGAESYIHNIVESLPHVRIVAFNNLYNHSRATYSSFESLAKRYLSWMRESQPQGPYHLAGWSFGGVLALEIARQLVVGGDQIATLALIDPYFNVRKACQGIGLPDHKRILDPINHVYQPNLQDLQRMAQSLHSPITLFKAGLGNEKALDQGQERLFEYYLRSRYNALDTLVDPRFIRVVELTGATHFTWIHHQSQVQKIRNILMRALRQ